MVRKTIVLNSRWIKDEDWLSCITEIELTIPYSELFDCFDKLHVVDENGINIGSYFKEAFFYSIERKKLLLEKDKDEY